MQVKHRAAPLNAHAKVVYVCIYVYTYVATSSNYIKSQCSYAIVENNFLAASNDAVHALFTFNTTVLTLFCEIRSTH